MKYVCYLRMLFDVLRLKAEEFHGIWDMGYVLLTQYCSGNKIEKNEMGWACGVYG